MAAACSQKASLHPTSEMPFHPLPGTLHTKKPKHITCKCTLSVLLGVFHIPPKHYLHTEFKMPVFRASGINGVRHNLAMHLAFHSPALLLSQTTQYLLFPCEITCCLKKLSGIFSTGEFKSEFRALLWYTTHQNHHLLILNCRILPRICHTCSCPVIMSRILIACYKILLRRVYNYGPLMCTTSRNWGGRGEQGERNEKSRISLSCSNCYKLL